MDTLQPTNTPPSVIEKVFDFVDERVGLKTLQAKMLNEPVPGGSRWAYVFGSILLFIFIMQAVTGILLMFYYVPTADHAYASTQYIIHDVDYGWFLLSYHFWGSTAMVVTVFAHMSQVFLWGAYKKPREMVWLVGLALFGLVMGFGFTGYLLPWDQRAYWATTVGVEIMDKTPLLGDFMARFLKGGPTPGQMTLSRFFVIHVMILPAALMGLAGLHIFPVPQGRSCRSVPRHYAGVEDQDRLFLSAAGLERYRGDGRRVFEYLYPGLLGACRPLGGGDARSWRLPSGTGVVFSVSLSDAPAEDLRRGARTVPWSDRHPRCVYGAPRGPALHRP